MKNTNLIYAVMMVVLVGAGIYLISLIAKKYERRNETEIHKPGDPIGDSKPMKRLIINTNQSFGNINPSETLYVSGSYIYENGLKWELDSLGNKTGNIGLGNPNKEYEHGFPEGVKPTEDTFYFSTDGKLRKPIGNSYPQNKLKINYPCEAEIKYYKEIIARKDSIIDKCMELSFKILNSK